jgi:hypothetical protein
VVQARVLLLLLLLMLLLLLAVEVVEVPGAVLWSEAAAEDAAA